MENLHEIEKNQHSIGMINMYDEHCLIEDDFIQVNEDDYLYVI